MTDLDDDHPRDQLTERDDAALGAATPKVIGGPWLAASVVTAGAIALVVLVGVLMSARSPASTTEPNSMSPRPAPANGTTPPTPSTKASPAETTPSSAEGSASATPSPEQVSAPPPEIVFRHGASGTLEFVVGMAEGDYGRVAAVNVQDGEGISPTGPWAGDGAVYIEQPDGSWMPVDTGGTFQDIRISYLFAPAEDLLVIYETVGVSSPVARQVTGVWVSRDGVSWSEATVEPHRGVIAEGPVGYVQALVSESDNGAALLEIYTSADALGWQLSHAIDVPERSALRDVGVGADGYVVTYFDGTRDRILASSDGSIWHAAPEQPSLGVHDILLAISDIGHDWVGVGWADNDSSAIVVWWSSDGLNWERVATLTRDIPNFGYPGHLFDLGERLFLSAGFAMEGTDTRPAYIWTSLGGRNWQPLDLGSEAEVRSGLATDCCLLLGGRIGIDAGEAVIWRWDSEH